MIKKILFCQFVLLPLLILPVAILFSCSKSKCETWEYTMECQEFTSGACNGFNPATKFTAVLCGDQLNGIAPGASVVTSSDTQKKVTRHYTRRVN